MLVYLCASGDRVCVAHHRDRLRDVRIAVAINEGQPKHAHVETFEREEEALGAAGDCDQAHLVAEFRAIAGLTPRVLLGELPAAPSVG